MMSGICQCGSCCTCRQRASMRRVRERQQIERQKDLREERIECEALQLVAEGRTYPIPPPSMFGILFDFPYD